MTKLTSSHLKIAVIALLILGVCAVLPALALANDDSFVGFVQHGRFLKLTPCEPVWQEVRLTSISMEMAVLPETKELDLTEHQGKVIVVCGHDGGGWIYSATVAETASPLLANFILRCYPGLLPCKACLERINSATQEDFKEIDQIDVDRPESLIAGQPYVVPDCAGASDIEVVLAEVPGIADVLRERIVRHFCPELYKEDN